MTYLACSCGFCAPVESLPWSCLREDGYAYCPECGGKMYAETRRLQAPVTVLEREDVPMPEAFADFVLSLDLSDLEEA